LRYTLYVQGWRDTESTICCGADRNCNADNQRTCAQRATPGAFAIEWFTRRWVNKTGPRGQTFTNYICRGTGERERSVRLPLAHTEGHLLVVGTTGAGKTRLFDLMVTQAVLRGEAVVIIDPKGDQDLRNAAERACRLVDAPERFVHFHSAFPRDSARIDPLHSFNRATEVASRVAALIPSETGNDPFKAFGQIAMSNVVQGLLAVGERPSLVTLRRYLEGVAESLVERAQVVYLGLDALSDSMVGGAIGSILVADLAAVAGGRYNYGVSLTPVNVFIDEAAEVVNDPFIQLLNKGRGAGLRLTVATQTFADFAARTGSEAKARQVLGNINNLVALRVLDAETQ
jgi:hypothetical protein